MTRKKGGGGRGWEVLSKRPNASAIYEVKVLTVHHSKWQRLHHALLQRVYYRR
jgi:hypothetical protein